MSSSLIHRSFGFFLELHSRKMLSGRTLWFLTVMGTNLDFSKWLPLTEGMFKVKATYIYLHVTLWHVGCAGGDVHQQCDHAFCVTMPSAFPEGTQGVPRTSWVMRRPGLWVINFLFKWINLDCIHFTFCCQDKHSYPQGIFFLNVRQNQNVTSHDWIPLKSVPAPTHGSCSGTWSFTVQPKFYMCTWTILFWRLSLQLLLL